MDTESKQKLAVFIVLLGFFVESLFGGYYFFVQKMEPVIPKNQIAILETNPQEVKGISFSAYDNVINFSYFLMIISANVLAIVLVSKFVFDKNKK